MNKATVPARVSALVARRRNHETPMFPRFTRGSHIHALAGGRVIRGGMRVKGRKKERELLFLYIFLHFLPVPCFTLRR